MPDVEPELGPPWEDKKKQLLEVINSLKALETHVSGDVLKKIRTIEQDVAEVTATDPGTRNIGPGD